MSSITDILELQYYRKVLKASVYATKLLDIIYKLTLNENGVDLAPRCFSMVKDTESFDGVKLLHVQKKLCIKIDYCGNMKVFTIKNYNKFLNDEFNTEDLQLIYFTSLEINYRNAITRIIIILDIKL